MKKFFMMMAAAASLFAAACDKEENSGEEPNLGFHLTSTPLEGSQFDEFTDTEMRFVLVLGFGVSTLQMNRVKFAERMPRLDIEVPGIALDDDGHFSAAAIVPTYNGAEMPAYTMTDFVLEVDSRGRRMTVAFDCMMMHVEYSGEWDYKYAE